jgi:hypothetical protein
VWVGWKGFGKTFVSRFRCGIVNGFSGARSGWIFGLGLVGGLKCSLNLSCPGNCCGICAGD